MNNMNKKWMVAGASVLLGLTMALGALAIEDTVVNGPKGSSVTVSATGSGIIRNAEVTAISGTTLTVRVWLMDWTVTTFPETNFRRRFDGNSELAEIIVGDRIDVWGAVSPTVMHTISARKIHDRSILKSAIQGTISSVSVPGTDGNTVIIVTTERYGDVSVTLTPQTRLKAGDAADFKAADLVVGMQVKVRGSLRPIAKTMTATHVIVTVMPVPVTTNENVNVPVVSP